MNNHVPMCPDITSCDRAALGLMNGLSTWQITMSRYNLEIYSCTVIVHEGTIDQMVR